MLFYKGGLYKAHRTHDEVIQVWVLYPPRWNEDNHYLEDIASALLICFVIGSLIALLYLIAIYCNTFTNTIIYCMLSVFQYQTIKYYICNKLAAIFEMMH